MFGSGKHGSDVRGPVSTALPRPTGRYLVMGALALIAAGAAWGIYEDPGNVVTIVGWAGGVVLVCWVVLVRPTVTAYQNGLQLTNMVRDVFIPWERIERVRATNVFRVVTDEGTYSCTGVGRSVRAQVRSDERYADRPTMASTMLGTGASRALGLGAQTDKGPSVPDYVEQVVTREAGERTRARKRSGDPPRPIRQAWALDGIGALILAVTGVIAAITV